MCNFTGPCKFEVNHGTKSPAIILSTLIIRNYINMEADTQGLLPLEEPYSITCSKSLVSLVVFPTGDSFGWPTGSIATGLRSFGRFKIYDTFFSSNAPVHTVVRPEAHIASCAYAVAIVAS